MNLTESAMWDVIEPYIFGEEGFGAGQQRQVPIAQQPSGGAKHTMTREQFQERLEQQKAVRKQQKAN